MRFLVKGIIFTLFITQFCSAQWYSLPTGITTELNSVYFTDSTTGWVAGDYGKILKTTDGGDNWSSQNSGTAASLQSVYFTDSTTGWIVGVSGKILKTTDGGDNWLSQSSGTSYDLNSIYFTDFGIGWIVGNGGTIMKTSDQGNSWVNQISGTSINLCSVYFINSDIGWAVGGGNGGIFLKTTDGGINWVSQSLGTSILWTSVVFTDTNKGWIAGGYFDIHSNAYGSLIKTTDGGDHWTGVLNTFYFLPTVFFPDSNTGFVVGGTASGKIYRTSNAGENWVIQVNGNVPPISSVYFLDKDVGWATTYNGIVLKTTNSGVTFIREGQLEEQPKEYSILQNYPNPFNPTTKIKYAVPRTSQVQIKIYDVLGNEIKTLLNEQKLSGTYEITWNAADLPSGVYFYQMRAGNFVQTRKMILLK